MRNSSGRAQAVRALTSSGWKQLPGPLVRTRFKLGSTDFDVHALTLDAVPQRLVYGDHVVVHGWLRGLGRARLQELTDRGLADGPSHPSGADRAVRRLRPREPIDGVASRLQRCCRRCDLAPGGATCVAHDERWTSPCTCLTVACRCRCSGSRAVTGVQWRARGASSTGRCGPAATASRCQVVRRTRPL